MQFLKILLWVLVAFSAAMFTLGNWSWVPINLWGGLVAEVNLPFLLLVTFLIGVVPTWLYYRTIRWRLSQRLAAAERVIADLKPVVPVGSGFRAEAEQEASHNPIAPPTPLTDAPAMPIGAAESEPLPDSKPKAKTKPRSEPEAPAAPFTLTP